MRHYQSVADWRDEEIPRLKRKLHDACFELISRLVDSVTSETGRNGRCASASGVSGTLCSRSPFIRIAGIVQRSRLTSAAESRSAASLKRHAVKMIHRSMRAASLVSPVSDFQNSGISS